MDRLTRRLYRLYAKRDRIDRKIAKLRVQQREAFLYNRATGRITKATMTWRGAEYSSPADTTGDQP